MVPVSISYLCEMRQVIRFFLTLSVLFVVLGLCAQSPTELRNKREKLLRDLERTTERLNATKKQRSAAIGRLNLLQRQIEQRRELINTLNQEIELTDVRIALNQDFYQSLHRDLEDMRLEYGETLRAMDRNRLTQGWLVFIFSADGINDVFRRFQYLRQYQEYRRRQSRLIRDTQVSLDEKSQELSLQREEKTRLLTVAEEQGGELDKALSTQTSLVDELTGAEKKLFERVSRQESEAQQLEKAIAAAITDEMAAARRREERTAPAGGNAPPPAPDIGGDFSNFRGRLPWPAAGDVVKSFGRQPHPMVPSVTITNGGIDIEAGRSARVQAVFPGIVLGTPLIPGYRQTVMVKHGNYYTVYSNLDRILLQAGDEVEAGTTVGFTSPAGDALHFELWRGKDRQDPKRWLN